jgi:hypothetical protein
MSRALQVLQTYHEKIANEGIIRLSPIYGILTRWAFDWLPMNRSGSTLPPPTVWTGNSLAQVGVPADRVAPFVGVILPPDGPVGQYRILYGAVEKFSGASAIGTYVIQIGAYDEPGWLSYYSTDPSAYHKFQIRLLKKTKDLYVAIGLLDVWKAINSVRSILGEAPLSRPNYADWSFRAISNIVGQASLRAIQRFIVSTPPIDTPQTPSLIPVGFRTLLAV